MKGIFVATALALIAAASARGHTADGSLMNVGNLEPCDQDDRAARQVCRACAGLLPDRRAQCISEYSRMAAQVAVLQALKNTCDLEFDRRRPHVIQDPPPPQASILHEAIAFDAQGKGREAVSAYAYEACRSDCRAVNRLREIYGKGLIGMPVDRAEVQKWDVAAERSGCDAPEGGWFQAASALEAEGRGADAVSAYKRAAGFDRQKHARCAAANRLGEIYGDGLMGVPKDRAESVKWYNMARTLGCQVAIPTRK